jgi:hypothetical protein
MQLGRQAAPRAIQRVISRLGGAGPTRRLDLSVAVAAGAGGVLMRPHNGESTLTSQVISSSASARPCNTARMRVHTPVRCQRRYSPYTVRQCP